jgi:hypothetical protein
MRRVLAVGVMAGLVMAARGGGAKPDEASFRELYKELVETNTSLSAGDCTLAAKAAVRLKAADIRTQMRVFVPEGHPKEGGSQCAAPARRDEAVLMLGHLDVWKPSARTDARSVFRIEEDAFSTGAALRRQGDVGGGVDTLIQMQEGYGRVQSTLALTCGRNQRRAKRR